MWLLNYNKTLRSTKRIVVQAIAKVPLDEMELGSRKLKELKQQRVNAGPERKHFSSTG